MGNSHSCVGNSHGAQLLQLAASGNIHQARQVLEAHPASSIYSTYVERNTPLLVAAGCGHYHLVQAILEAAVIAHGPSKAMRCINHTNKKGHTALMLACMNGHAPCVEALIQNGASPLALDSSRHNTALHWAASCCRSECVQRLLASSATFQMQSGEVVPIARIPCYDEDNRTLVKLVDRHNGWGWTALHLAVFKGSTSTVRALLRNGAAVDSRTVPSTVACSPIRQAEGSTALHMAAAAEDLPMVRLLLDAQITQNVTDLRQAVNSSNERPIDVARTVNNLLLLHLLDPSQPLSSVTAAPHVNVTLYPGSEPGSVRGHVISAAISDSYALDAVIGLSGLGYRGLAGLRGGSSRRTGGSSRGDQPPHVMLNNMLQKLRLVLSLEAMAVETKLAAAARAAAAAVPTCVDDVDACGSKHDVAASLDLKARLSKKVALSDDWSAQRYVSSSSSSSWQQQQQLASDSDSSSAADTIPAAPDVPAAAAAAAAAAAGTASDTSDDSEGSGAVAAAAAAAAAAAVQNDQFSSRQRILLHKKVLLKAAQRQLIQQQATAEAAALRSRLETLQSLLQTIQEMLLLLPQTPSGSSAAAATGSAAAEEQQQEDEGIVSLVRNYNRRRRRHRSNRHDRFASNPLDSILDDSSSRRQRSSSNSTGAGSSSSWGLLRRLSSGTAGNTSRTDPNSGNRRDNHQGTAQRNVISTLQAHRSENLDVFDTEGIFLEAGDRSPAAAAAPSAVAVEEVLAAFITPSTLSSLAAVTKLLVSSSALSGKQPTAAAAAGSSGVDARWAEQEHALVLLRSILQAAHSSLKASQQAITLAANRLALRQRQQQQLAAILGNERRLMNSSRAARRLLLGGLTDQSPIHRGQLAAASGGTSSRERRRERRMERSAAARDRSAGRERSRGSRRNRLERLSGLRRNSSGSAPVAAAVGNDDSIVWHSGDPNRSLPITAAAAAHAVSTADGGNHPVVQQSMTSTAAASSSLAVLDTGRLGSNRRHHCNAWCGRHRGGSSSGSAVPNAASITAAVEQLQQQRHDQRMQMLQEAMAGASNTEQQQPQQRQDGRDSSITNVTATPEEDSAAAATAAGLNHAVAQDGTDYFSQSTDASDVETQQQQQQEQQNMVIEDMHGEISAAPNEVPTSSLSQDRTMDQLELHADTDSSHPTSCSPSRSDSESEQAASICSSLDASTCAICMDSKAAVSVTGCSHMLCMQCAYQLCCKAKGAPLCPFCRQPIAGFGVGVAAADGEGVVL